MNATENRQTLQDKVLEYLEDNGIRKSFFAKQIDVSPAMLSHWFVGRTSFNEQKLSAIKKIIAR